MTIEHELEKNQEKTLITLTNHAYLIDHDPIENYLYFVECSMPIRSVIMSCAKTRGIFRINLNRAKFEKEVRDILLSINDIEKFSFFSVNY
jgi:hypothetical protein